MTLEKRLVNRVAVCKARLAKNNTITIKPEDVETIGAEPGDTMRTRVTKVDTEREVEVIDSDVFEAPLQKTRQLTVPSNTREKLGLQPGDLLQYITFPTKNFPGLDDGPVRDRIRGRVQERERPERESMRETFTAPMQQTGQVTVPSDVMDDMGLLQGDVVTAEIEWQGESEIETLEIGTGNRITIPKSTREDLGLESGDEPTITLTVFE